MKIAKDTVHYDSVGYIRKFNYNFDSKAGLNSIFYFTSCGHINSTAAFN